MKTKTHVIQGADMNTIEALDYLGTPDWVPHIVAIEGTETSALDEAMVQTQHFSGLLRECSRSEFVEDGVRLTDEDGKLHELGGLLDDAAERLDQAHMEWLQQRDVLDAVNKLSNTLDVEVRNVYGVDRFYPANDKARKMADLLGRKTLNQSDLIDLAEQFHFAIRLTNAVAHNWLPMATGMIGEQS